jgi:hypothetical protein
MESRVDLLNFIRENEILGFKSKPKKITVVDQGERTIWNSLQKIQLKPPSYYVHAHMTDSYISLKLHQIVDITASNNGVSELATIFIEDAYLAMKDTFQQVGELIWCHIQSLDEKEREEFAYPNGDCPIDYASDNAKFQEGIQEFIKNKVTLEISNAVESSPTIY